MHGMRRRPSHRLKRILEWEPASFYIIHMEPPRADKMPPYERQLSSFFLPGALLTACQMATAGNYRQQDTLWGASTARTVQAIPSHRLTLPACSPKEKEGFNTFIHHLRVEHAQEGSTQYLPSVGRYAPLCLQLRLTLRPLSNLKCLLVDLIVFETSLVGMKELA